jgi:hypothetical protein
MNSRFMHRLDAGLPYQAGRHSIDLPDSQWTWAERGFIAKYRWTPWPEGVARKRQQLAKMSPALAIPSSDWRYMNEEQLHLKREAVINGSVVRDFSRPLGASDVELRASRDWFEACRGDVRLDESK